MKKTIQFINTTILLMSNQNIPSIEGPNEIYIAYSENLSIEQFTNKYFTFSDIETPKEKLKVKYKYQLTLNWPNTSCNIITITDEDNNFATKPFTLYVKDDLGPKIYGPDSISFDYNSIPNTKEILSYYSSFDEVDGPCTISLEKELTTSSTSFTLISLDKSKNITTKNVKLNLLNEPKYWYVETTLNITNKSYLSASSIIDTLIENNYLQKIDYTYAYYIDPVYEKNYMITGLYEVEIEIYTLELKEPFIIKVKLNVSNENTNKQEEITTTPWWEKIFYFIKKLFQKIINFFFN